LTVNQQPARSDAYLVHLVYLRERGGEWPGDGFSHAEWSGEQFQRQEGTPIERVTDGLMAWRPSAFFVAEFAQPKWKLLSYFETWILVITKL
jgi:hypothetical protein